MIYPIRAYGDPVLRAKCEEITNFGDDFQKLVEDMFETMDESDGVGLAAPQIGKNIRLFVIDSTLFDKKNEGEGVRQAFVNPIILAEEGEHWPFEEGCLSIPEIREDVQRKPSVKIQYKTIQNEEKTEVFEGMSARVIQHEFDHIEGILFIDHLESEKNK